MDLYSLLEKATKPVLFQATLALNGKQEELGYLIALQSASHLKVVGHYNLRKATEMTRQGKPANVTLVIKVADPVKFAQQVKLFDILFWTLAEQPDPNAWLVNGDVFTQDGEWDFRLDRKAMTFTCLTKIPDSFTLAL